MPTSATRIAPGSELVNLTSQVITGSSHRPANGRPPAESSRASVTHRLRLRLPRWCMCVAWRCSQSGPPPGAQSGELRHNDTAALARCSRRAIHPGTTHVSFRHTRRAPDTRTLPPISSCQSGACVTGSSVPPNIPIFNFFIFIFCPFSGFKSRSWLSLTSPSLFFFRGSIHPFYAAVLASCDEVLSTLAGGEATGWRPGRILNTTKLCKRTSHVGSLTGSGR